MHIVLVNPKIPQNTGSIARTCAATNSPLHIVGEPAFEISDKKARRAGLDYWPHVKLFKHTHFDVFLEKVRPANIWLFTKFANHSYTKAKYSSEDCLVFGSETTGLGEAFLSKYPLESQVQIPMENKNVRSLNLSNAVSIALYEAIRQISI